MILRNQISGFLATLIFSLCSISTIYAQYRVGDTVDNFTLNDVDGNPYTLYDFKGKVILLNFFATW